jgi:uncharacterized membrane protein
MGLNSTSIKRYDPRVIPHLTRHTSTLQRRNLVDSERTPGQQQVYDRLRREFYRERMRAYDEEYYAAREKREEEEANEERRRKESPHHQNRKVSEREERFNFLTKLCGVLFVGGWGVGFIYIGFEELGDSFGATILSVFAILLGIVFLLAAWKFMGKNFSDSEKQDNK